MDGLDGNGLLKTYALSMEKWRLEHLGALGIMDETVFRPRFEGQPRKTENEFNHNRLKRGPVHPCYGVIDVVN